MTTSEHQAWWNAKQRCTNPNHPAYKDYGGRGITMWAGFANDFELFLTYVGEKPSPEYTIERINNDRGYEPGNIMWATRQEQIANRRPFPRTTHKLSDAARGVIKKLLADGVHTQREIAEIFDISQTLVCYYAKQLQSPNPDQHSD